MEQFGMITATASVLPEKIITNNDLSKMRIPLMNGFRQGRVFVNEDV